MQLPTNLIITNEDLNTVAKTVYAKAKQILKDSFHKHYTDHSITHSERILAYIDKLIDKMTNPLSNEERFVLVCAVLLHDIGMQAPNYYFPEQLGNFPLNYEELEKLREIHHELSKRMIIESVSKSNPKAIDLGLGFNEKTKRLAETIAIVAEHHRKLDIDKVEDNGIRKKLLCSLMRIGDCMDCDYNRVDLESLNRFNIEPQSKFFWYSHHYVHEVNVINQKIKIVFKFPNSYKEDNITDSIISHIINDIKRHIDDVFKHLYDADLRMYNEVEYQSDYSHVITEQIPPDVRESIESKKEKYTQSDGFGKITFYWGGDRETSNDNIVQYLSTTKSSSIFIATVGFTTINSVLNKDEVIHNFHELIKESKPENPFKITLILPDSPENFKKIRPELSNEHINQNYERAQNNLAVFKRKLANICFSNMELEDDKVHKISQYIEIKKYNIENYTPRYFIMHGSDDTIFIGPYFGYTTGVKSYLMELKKTNMNEEYKFGLFDLFVGEVLHIQNNSLNTNL